MLEQMGLAGLNSILGSQNNYGLANQMSPQYQQQLYQQAQWNAAMAQNKPQWVFNGVKCNSAREMADIIWPNSCPEKTHFLLKYE